MLGRDESRDAARIHFTLRAFHLPVWRTDHPPEGIDRRRLDRRLREESGYDGPEWRAELRRETVGTVVAHRAVYDGRTSESTE